MAGSEIVITGADGEPYRQNGAHRDGRALDLRSRNFPNPAALAECMRKLGYDVLFGDKDHLDHIHVGIPKGWR